MTGAATAVENSALTRAILAALDAAQLREIAAAYAFDLDSMQFGHWRSDDDIYPASVIKIAIMAQAYRCYQEGVLSPDDRIAIAAANLTPTAEETPLVAGYEARVQELVDLMIERSDNIATNQLIDVLRRERVTGAMHGLGLSSFLLARKLSGASPLVDDPESVGRNSMSPAAAAGLLRLIAGDAIPGARAQQDLLARCVHNDKLTLGLRPGDRFMHKTGETDSVSHDAGILHTAQGRRYVVVLYTTPPTASSNSPALLNVVFRASAASSEGKEITVAGYINPQMADWMRRLRESL